MCGVIEAEIKKLTLRLHHTEENSNSLNQELEKVWFLTTYVY
jgi:hypothetical protein